MWTISELKDQGKAAFRANYWKSVLCALLLSLFVGGTAINLRSDQTQNIESISNSYQQLTPSQQIAIGAILAGALSVVFIISILLKIFLYNPIQVGCYGFFRENVATSGQGDLNALKSGFTNYGHTFITLFLKDLFLALWSMLFIIPGIVKGYSWCLVPYLLSDDPNLDYKTAMQRSAEMMQGRKMQKFLLDLSFIGWVLMGLVTLGIGMLLWTAPYMEAADAEWYAAVAGKDQNMGYGDSSYDSYSQEEYRGSY